MRRCGGKRASLRHRTVRPGLDGGGLGGPTHAHLGPSAPAPISEQKMAPGGSRSVLGIGHVSQDGQWPRTPIRPLPQLSWLEGPRMDGTYKQQHSRRDGGRSDTGQLGHGLGSASLPLEPPGGQGAVAGPTSVLSAPF
jgi:hypothetical protein